MQLIRIRRVGAHIPGQIVHIVQTVIVDASGLNMPDLCKDLSLRRLHCNLDIAGNDKHVIALEAVAFTHPVHGVVQPEIFRSAAEHSFSYVKYAFQNPLIVHCLTHFLCPVFS